MDPHLKQQFLAYLERIAGATIKTVILASILDLLQTSSSFYITLEKKVKTRSGNKPTAAS
jgi:hypothetical protein